MKKAKKYYSPDKDIEELPHIYVHESHTLWADSGELHIECDNGSIVFNMDALFNDLPSIVDYCLEHNLKNREYIINQLTVKK